jgi:hypothetical protein
MTVFEGSMTDPSTFEARPELFRTDGDITLVFLSANGITFTKPTKDPWYAVSDVPGSTLVYVDDINEPEKGSQTDLYYSTEPASPLACLEQFQYCNPNLPEETSCTRLGSRYDAASEARQRVFNVSEPELTRFIWIMRALTLTSANVIQLVSDLGPQSLSSRHGLSDSAQGPIPDNQWQLDVAQWFSIILATIQNAAVAAALGPPSEELEKWTMRPNSTEEYKVCKNQVSHSSRKWSHLLEKKSLAC